MARAKGKKAISKYAMSLFTMNTKQLAQEFNDCTRACNMAAHDREIDRSDRALRLVVKEMERRDKLMAHGYRPTQVYSKPPTRPLPDIKYI